DYYCCSYTTGNNWVF
nr:immunoglobulin light chain junction region [Macaca mulatta]MOW28082.1 immunoglobulin light chain junction region [Macaca mulatta]MOW30537.1 immunoglobulin light chain junction region [Macaca mulatta]